MSELEPTQPAATPTPAPTPANDNTTLMGILAYLGPLVFIPFFTAKDQPFVRFHVRQGMVLFVLEAIVWVVDEMMYLGPFWPLFNVIYLATLIFTIIGIINVVNKHEKELPLIGQFAKYFNF